MGCRCEDRLNFFGPDWIGFCLIILICVRLWSHLRTIGGEVSAAALLPDLD